jgi:hypothetical protein
MEPMRVRPTTLAAEPARTKLRTDIELPKSANAMTDAENTDPTRDNPMTLAPEPQRANERTDRELPKCKKSKIDPLDAQLTNPATDTEDPSRA